MRIGWGGLGTLAAVLLTAASALGQTATQSQGKKPPPAEIVSIDLGWHQSLLSRDRWQPVTVWITSRDKPFSGIISVEFPADHTQKSQLIVGPVATTPGMVTPVEIEMAPCQDAQEVIITLTNGRFSTSAHYHAQPRSDQLQLPHVGMSRCGLMVFVGRTSASKTVDARSTSSLNGQLNSQNQFGFPGQSNGNRSGFKEADVWDEMMPALVAPDRLPLSWIAYESADVVVCNAADIANLDSRAEAALSKWVESGGRLVVRVDPVGPVWPRFLPTSMFAVSVVGSEQQLLEPGQELRAMLPNVVLSNFQARLLTLTSEGKSRGWITQFQASKPGQDASGALVASGPHGLGMVTLISFDPGNIAALIDDEAVKQVWRRAIRPILPPHAILAGYSSQSFGGWDPGDSELTGATNAALDQLAVVPPIGTGMFWLIALFMGLLAFAIGPFDAKFLKKRRLSQHSWVTAIGWILIASAGAALAPRLMRSGETVAGRVLATDTICDAEGVPLQSAGQGLTGIFAGRPIQLALEGAKPGAWLRGVSAVQFNYGRQNRLIGLPDLTLTPNTQEADVPLRGAWADTIGIPQWSFRTLADSTPMLPAQSSDIGARMRDVGEDWEVTLTNVPSSAIIGEVWINLGEDKWCSASGPGTTSPNGRDRTFVAPKGLLTTRPPGAAHAKDAGEFQGYQITERNLASLPWMRERGQAIDTMVNSGNYACVCVSISGIASDLKVTGGSNIREQYTRFMRLLTPMPVEDNK